MVGQQTSHLNAAGGRLPAWRGEAEDMRLARASLLLMYLGSGRRMGSPTMHKDVKLTADAGASILILISQMWQVSADSVM